MSELVFLKLGGSLLTDKTRPQGLRREALDRLAAEIAAALAEKPGLQLVLGHGSGSYGHVVAHKYGTRRGVSTPEQWRGFAETAVVAAQLNRLVTDALAAAGVPVLPIQPSASARCRGGRLVALETGPLAAGLAQGLVPLVYGDVAFDETQGGTIIATEEIFRWLAPRLAPARILLVGEVAGVFTRDPALAGPSEPAELIPRITPATLADLAQGLGGSRGMDVTGGMVAKVAEMLALLAEAPTLRSVQLISGLEPGLVRRALADPTLPAGTRLER